MIKNKCPECKEPLDSFFEMHVECCEKAFGHAHEWCKHGCLRCGISRIEDGAGGPDEDRE